MEEENEKITAQDIERDKRTAEGIRKIARRFTLVPIILGVLVAKTQGKFGLILSLIFGLLLIPAAIWLVKFEKKRGSR